MVGSGGVLLLPLLLPAGGASTASSRGGHQHQQAGARAAASRALPQATAAVQQIPLRDTSGVRGLAPAAPAVPEPEIECEDDSEVKSEAGCEVSAPLGAHSDQGGVPACGLLAKQGECRGNDGVVKASGQARATDFTNMHAMAEPPLSYGSRAPSHHLDTTAAHALLSVSIHHRSTWGAQGDHFIVQNDHLDVTFHSERYIQHENTTLGGTGCDCEMLRLHRRF
ncbi:hypothetical protein HaLaN_24900 [Haematococcus lacustris]|uniref:Uncharacterized protein n=1 Tax=Haematococcus lacustris TaxID=44745 RepID=A0A6A0A3X0_HAELA|nr:hypothetical protein HaLaN_24900 [Haematococcus lacustris]